MTKIRWENAGRGLCVVCGGGIGDPGGYVCLKCRRPCGVCVREVGGGLSDARSTCCGADVQISRRITCSGPCHEELVRRLVDEFGEYKVVVDAEGVRHMVPTRYIIERGLRHDELRNFPVFGDG